MVYLRKEAFLKLYVLNLAQLDYLGFLEGFQGHRLVIQQSEEHLSKCTRSNDSYKLEIAKFSVWILNVAADNLLRALICQIISTIRKRLRAQHHGRTCSAFINNFTLH